MIIPANSTSHALWGIQLLRISANPMTNGGRVAAGKVIVFGLLKQMTVLISEQSNAAT